MARFRHSSLLPWTAVALVGALSAPATAAQRVALAIGNASYEHAPALANPLNDAADMDAALERLGFKVTRLENVDQASLRRGLQDFALAASASEVAVVFYAGHGIEVDQRNFLVPVDARLASDQDVEFEAVPLELVQRAVERASGLRLVILDACRENPFAVKMQRAGATRSIGRGLARVEPSGETLIAYAAKEGTVAADGAGRHSPFSEALLAHLEEPGLEVGLMFRKVRDAVLASTGGRQEPFVYGSLSSRGVYLSGPPSPAGSPAATVTEPDNGTMPERVTSEQLAARAYEAAERVGAVVAYEAVIRRFPESIFAELARAQVEKLRVAEASATSDGRVAIATTPEGAPAPPPVSVSTPQGVESSLELERSERRWIQAALASLGYGPGPADGLFGSRTRGAIRRYQGEKGLDETGYLTADLSKTLVALGEEAAKAQARREAAHRADDAEFAGAKSRGTVAAYASYLESYPSGRHVAEARRLRSEAVRAEGASQEEAPVRRFRDCAECPEMVVVPAGSYMMGSPSGEAGSDDDEGPVHRVRITEPLAVGVYEVTFGEWEACRRGGGCTRNPDDEGWGRGSRPVIDVSWEDAQVYVRWLSWRTGKRYRLLSESEWEYVARAGTTTRYHWGDAVSRNRANCDGCGSRWDDERTASVGSFRPNGFGLHDVHGNVWEWVEDCWHERYAGAPRDGRAWTSGGDCSSRVMRGGSWYLTPRFMRSADRYRSTARGRRSDVGFRVARTLD